MTQWFWLQDDEGNHSRTIPKAGKSILVYCLPFSRLRLRDQCWRRAFRAPMQPDPAAAGPSIRCRPGAFPFAGARLLRPPNHTTYHVQRRQRPAANIAPLRLSLNATVHLCSPLAAAVEPIDSTGIVQSFACQSNCRTPPTSSRPDVCSLIPRLHDTTGLTTGCIVWTGLNECRV